MQNNQKAYSYFNQISGLAECILNILLNNMEQDNKLMQQI